MALSEEQIKELTKRLFLSRTRILINTPFYGLLLMQTPFAIDESCKTAYTDGFKIAFGSKFLAIITDDEVDIVLLHEIMHIVLKHCFRGNHLKDKERLNIACDIVVNSNIVYASGKDPSSIALRCDVEPWRLTPSGKEGYLYTVEEVYEMLQDDLCNPDSGSDSVFDDHGRWITDEDGSLSDLWDQRVVDAVKSSATGLTSLPKDIAIMIDERRNPKKDWRSILISFIQEEVNDYSFSPPDRRYEGDFFLPDFNDLDTRVKNILFVIDTSGSMSNDDISEMYHEIRGAIDQFNGKLSGWLGFFDDKVIPPVPFNTIEEFKIIRPKGGGGTNFECIFNYVRDNMADELPSAIVIMTDGYASFPDVGATMGIPVMWVINTDVTPPFGTLIKI